MSKLASCVRTTPIDPDDAAEIKAYVAAANGNAAIGIRKYLADLQQELRDTRNELGVGLEREYRQAINLTPGGGSRQFRFGATVVDYGVSSDGTTAEIILVKTAKNKRRMGSARAALTGLLSEFDRNGITTFLTPEPMGDKTVSKSALVAFYKSLGFRDNHGRKKDFRSQAAMVRDPRILNQQNRGSIVFPSDGSQSIINLFEKANLSTFLHESGHYFLNVLQDLADQQVTPEVSEMYATVRAWWGENAGSIAREAGVLKSDVETYLNVGTVGDDVKDAAIDTALQEQWARATEVYFMEGKAPTDELRSAFERFKSWLLNIYRRVAGLNVEVSDELRSVLDRMLATDAELDQARVTIKSEMIFGQEPVEGMTQADYDALSKLHAEANDQAAQRLLKKTMEPLAQKREQWWKDERAKVHAAVTENINSSPAYRAYEWLANGRWLGDDGAAPVGDFRINKAQLVERYGEGITKTLPRGKRAVYADDGADIDAVAIWFGFETGDGFVKSLEQAPRREEAIEQETDRLMRDRHGDALRDGGIEELATEAVQNDKRGQYLVAELKALKGLVGDTRPTFSVQQAREAARRSLAQMRVRDATTVNRFLAAERRAADDLRAATGTAARKRLFAQQGMRGVGAADRDGVGIKAVNKSIDQANAKTNRANLSAQEVVALAERRLMNHMLYNEGMKIVAEVEKAERFVKKLQKAMAKARSEPDKTPLAGEYLEALEELLYRYDFRKLSAVDERRRGALQRYVTMMVESGRAGELAIPAKVLLESERFPYRTLSVADFRGVMDTLRNIEHTARMKQKLIDAKETRDRDQVVASIVETIGANSKSKAAIRSKSVRDESRTWRDGVTSYLNIVKNTDTILRELDGFSDFGPAYTALKKSVDRGGNDAVTMKLKAQKDFEKLYAVYSKEERRAMMAEKEIAELGGEKFKKWDLISIVLNTGNEDNFARLTDKRVTGSFTPDQVQAVIRMMDKRDMDFIQSVWDYIDGYWPLIKEKEARATGVVPHKVPPRMVETPYGIYNGGYYPLRYDKEAKGTAAQDVDEISDVLQRGGFTKAQTANGHTKERGNFSGLPVMVHIGVVHSHINQVIHDLAFSEVVNNSWKVLNDPRVVEAFKDVGRQEDHKALRLWLLDVASGELKATDFLNKSTRFMRSAFTFSRLAFNLKSVIMQPLGVAQSMVVVGKRNFARGLSDMTRFNGGFRGASEYVKSVSPFMAERERTFNKDVLDFSKQSSGPVAGKFDEGLQLFKQAAYFAMTKMQFYTADLPTWFGGYAQGIGQGMNENDAIAHADRMVARAQGSGIFTDRSAIERGTVSDNTRQQDFIRMFTALGSYMFAKFNVAYERTQRADFKNPVAVVAYTADMLLLFAFESFAMMLVADLFNGDDEDDNFARDLATETVFSMAATLPVVRDAASGLRGFSTGGAYAGFLNDIVKPMQQINQGEIDKGLVKAFMNSAGISGAFPSIQANRTLDAIWRDLEGEDVSPVEYLFGKAR